MGFTRTHLYDEFFFLMVELVRNVKVSYVI